MKIKFTSIIGKNVISKLSHMTYIFNMDGIKREAGNKRKKKIDGNRKISDDTLLLIFLISVRKLL